MEQTDKGDAEKTESRPGSMNAEDTGDAPGGGQPGCSGASETTPLLVPDPEPEPEPEAEPEPEPGPSSAPMTKKELKAAAGGPWWRKARCCLVLLLWLAWLAMLAGSIAFIAMSPRPGAVRLRWFQKSLFYRLQPDLFTKGQTVGAGDINAMCEQMPYLKSLGIGALILEGLFEDKSLLSVNGTERFGSFPQIKHLITESNKTGLKLVLDLCELNLLGPRDVSRSTATVQHALRFWLEHGVAGFVICESDSAYPEEALEEWREVIDEFSRTNEERIIVVKQAGASLPPLNATLVDLVMKPILPSKRRRLSAHEVVAAIKTRLQAKEGNIWQSWTIGGKVPRNLKKLLLVLMMTMPGSPAVQYDAVLQTQNETLNVQMLHGERNYSSDGDNQTHSTAALFSSLARSRARESTLLYGSLTFLPYSNSSINSTSSSYPVLAFTRSWSCVRILVLLNVGPEIRVPDPDWALGLPEEGAFVASTGMDRMGPTTLDSLELQPHEAVVIKF